MCGLKINHVKGSLSLDKVEVKTRFEDYEETAQEAQAWSDKKYPLAERENIKRLEIGLDKVETFLKGSLKLEHFYNLR